MFRQIFRYSRLLRSPNYARSYTRKFARRPVSSAMVAASLGLGTATLTGLAYYNYRPALSQSIHAATTATVDTAGVASPDLPNYTLAEVAAHKTEDTRIWVIYKDGVYDITQFMHTHPGGTEKIVLAAGSSIEPYWDVFAAHNTDEVCEMLEELRIGNVHPSERGRSSAKIIEGPYANDPSRSPVLKVNTQTPFNAETPIVLLTESFITPNNLFFVRNHLPVPDIDPADYVLEVKGQNSEPVRLTLEDLRSKFKQYSITAAVQCAGNRRSELAEVKKVRGLNWTGGAIGNATWSGVRLRDVLLYVGVEEVECYSLKHIHLEGADSNPVTGERYGASVPIEKAMDPRGDCLLALEMNGEPLPRDHGYPVRVLVPGVVGARNVKWLTRVEASTQEYPGHWQQKDYKGFSPNIDWDTVDFSTAPAIQELPVTSLITSPQEGVTMERCEESVSVRGVAWSGGGREVVRVDVSADGGRTWITAELSPDMTQPLGRAWAWKQWEVSVPLPEGATAELCCKAVDTSYNVQPDTAGPIWNLRGCLSNAWHRVHCNIK